MRSLILLLGFLSATLQAEPVSIVLLPFENATEEESYDVLEEGIPELMSVCFSSYPEQIIVIDRSSLEAVINEQALNWTEFIEKESVQEVGKLVGAKYLIRGSLSSQGNNINIQALLFDTATTKLEHSVDGVISPKHITGGLCKKIAEPVVELLVNSSTGSAPLAVEKQPEKQLLLITGLSHYYNNDFAGAFPAFLELVKQFPDDPAAPFWLAKSFYAAGMEELARIQLEEFIEKFPGSARMKEAQKLKNELELARTAREKGR